MFYYLYYPSFKIWLWGGSIAIVFFTKVPIHLFFFVLPCNPTRASTRMYVCMYVCMCVYLSLGGRNIFMDLTTCDPQHIFDLSGGVPYMFLDKRENMLFHSLVVSQTRPRCRSVLRTLREICSECPIE